MKPQSKSKTFPKGTDLIKIGDWIDEQVPLKFKEFGYRETNEKVLITITKFPDKEEGK